MKYQLGLFMRVGVCWGVLVALSLLAVGAEPVGTSGGGREGPSARLRHWVARLGSPRFAEREQATAELIEMGMVAVPELERVMRGPDRESRHRSQLILNVIREVDFTHRIEQFQADESAEGPEYGFPSWPAFRELVGKEANSKALFVSMWRLERELMESSQRDPAKATILFDERCQSIQAWSQVSLNPQPFELAVTLIYLAGDERIPLHRESNMLIREIAQRWDRDSVSGSSSWQRKVLERLLARWVLRSDNQPAATALELALQYKLPEALERARPILDGGVQADLVDRFFAIFCATKYGNSSDVGRLEKQLSDEQVILSYMVDQAEYSVQLRDVALAALLVLTKQDFPAAGYHRLKVDEQTIFGENSLGFPSAETRDHALRYWRSVSPTNRSG